MLAQILVYFGLFQNTLIYHLIVLKSTSHDELSFTYCHISPLMYVNRNDHVKKGDFIATVGPKNVYGIENNPYKDLNGNPTNGATTGCHLHFTIKENGNAINPLNYYNLPNQYTFLQSI